MMSAPKKRTAADRSIANLLIADHILDGMEAFAYEWRASRIPATVTFPDDTTKSVQHMENGLLLFKDGTSAIYDIIDPRAKNVHSAVIAYNPS